MAESNQVRDDYNQHADSYDTDYAVLPEGVLESQLIKIALGDATGKSVLDLGGGTGIHAREAIEAGATSLVLVDISPEMIRVAKDGLHALTRTAQLQFVEADVSKPMDHHQFAQDQYDIVIASWVFDHAGSNEVLYAMWRNAIKYLKPGGKLIGTKVIDYRAKSLVEKYGVSLKDFQAIAGGQKYTVTIHSRPPFEFGGTTMDESMRPSENFYHDIGLIDIKHVPYEHTEVVQRDPEFWKVLLEDPWFCVFTGTKA
jgi:ubiquinone/menaquinone biosynthesis C-methylase UbiE